MVLNTPTVLMISPTCIMISPTVLNIPHGTQDNPHGTHDIPPWYWTPPWYSRYPPHLSWYPPRYWTPPRYSRYLPTVLMISPHGTDHPHGTAHTLYKVIFDYQAMLGIHVCQECLCPNSQVLTIEHVLVHIIPEHVCVIVILFILGLRNNFMFHYTITHPIAKDFYGLDAQVDNLTFLTASLSKNSWNPTT